MIGWLILQCLYFAIGGALSLLLVPELLRGQKFGSVGREPVTAFLLVFGTMLLWPLLGALAVDRGPH